MDTLINWTSITATTNVNTFIQPLNLIQTGTGSWNRIGRKVQPKSVRIMGYAQCNMFQDPANDIFGNMVRFILVWDNQPSGAAVPNFDNIFAQTSQAGAETSAWFSPTAYDTLDRFRVIKDWTINATPEVYPAAGNFFAWVCHIDEFVSLTGYETNYSGQSTPMTIADINSGALYLIGRARTNAAGSSTWDAEFTVRLRYTD